MPKLLFWKVSAPQVSAVESNIPEQGACDKQQRTSGVDSLTPCRCQLSGPPCPRGSSTICLSSTQKCSSWRIFNRPTDVNLPLTFGGTGVLIIKPRPVLQDWQHLLL
ncbi:hypothetical protein MRX96_028658 [Rhipicephalus microplus]